MTEGFQALAEHAKSAIDVSYLLVRRSVSPQKVTPRSALFTGAG